MENFQNIFFKIGNYLSIKEIGWAPLVSPVSHGSFFLIYFYAFESKGCTEEKGTQNHKEIEIIFRDKHFFLFFFFSRYRALL